MSETGETLRQADSLPRLNIPSIEEIRARNSPPKKIKVDLDIDTIPDSMWERPTSKPELPPGNLPTEMKVNYLYDYYAYRKLGLFRSREDYHRWLTDEEQGLDRLLRTHMAGEMIQKGLRLWDKRIREEYRGSLGSMPRLIYLLRHLDIKADNEKWRETIRDSILDNLLTFDFGGTDPLHPQVDGPLFTHSVTNLPAQDTEEPYPAYIARFEREVKAQVKKQPSVKTLLGIELALNQWGRPHEDESSFRIDPFASKAPEGEVYDPALLDAQVDLRTRLLFGQSFKLIKDPKVDLSWTLEGPNVVSDRGGSKRLARFLFEKKHIGGKEVLVPKSWRPVSWRPSSLLFGSP